MNLFKFKRCLSDETRIAFTNGETQGAIDATILRIAKCVLRWPLGYIVHWRQHKPWRKLRKVLSQDTKPFKSAVGCFHSSISMCALIGWWSHSKANSHHWFLTLFPLNCIPERSSLLIQSSTSSCSPFGCHLWTGVGNSPRQKRSVGIYLQRRTTQFSVASINSQEKNQELHSLTITETHASLKLVLIISRMQWQNFRHGSNTLPFVILTTSNYLTHGAEGS